MKEFILMLAILNPFAQALYLSEIMNRLQPREFAMVHLRASLLSLLVFVVFGLWGEELLKHVFQVRLGALQIFGGMIMLYLAHRYITAGAGSNLLFRGDITDLAPKISLPYMVGAGTIWVSILIGRKFEMHVAVGLLAGVLGINFLFVCIFQIVTHSLYGTSATRFGKYLAIFMRVNALFLGAIGIEMILKAIDELYGLKTMQ